MFTLFCLTLFLQPGLEGSSLTLWLFNSQWRKVQSCYYVIFSLQASLTLPDFCCCCWFTVLTKKAIKKITSSWFCRFNKCIALELGAGLGLCSIVLGRVAKKVFCTGMLKNTSKFKYLPWERVPALEITSVFTTEHACSLKCPHLLKS